MSTTLTARELGTVLAALRYWQATKGGAVSIPDDHLRWIRDIEEDDAEPLEAEEIDHLCERINCETTGEPDDPARDIDPEEDERAPLKCADNWEWRRGYEHELMAADDYVSALLNQ